VYAVGATMRACIEGKPPPPSLERHAADSLKPAADLYAGRYPAPLLEAIDWAMAVDARSRPRTASELRAALMYDDDSQPNTRSKLA
jgi:hypothetical protein